jgi:hypothetical protein
MTRWVRASRLLGRLALLALLVSGSANCNVPRADEQSCDEIFDRIVALELRERGFRDPALQARKQRELRHTLAPELRQCAGKRLLTNALACVRRAKSTEEISHICLR